MGELLRSKKKSWPACWRAGQTLLEVIAAMSVGAVVIAAITVLVITSLSNEQFSKNQNAATQYAQSAMEMVRRVRDTDWALFSSYETGKYCVADSENTFPGVRHAACGPAIPCTYNAGPVVNGNKTFAREVCIEKDSVSCEVPNFLGGSTASLVTVRVLWTDGKCTGGVNCHEAKLVSCLSNVNVLPAP